MHELIGYTLSGLVTASIFATVACGLTLTYTTTGIFNWAQGSMVAVGAFSYWQLSVDWGWPRPVAMAVCLVLIGPGLGWIIERVIMFRLEGTSETTRMVVTLALLLGTLGGVNAIWDPSVPRTLTPLADGQVLTVLGQRLPYNDLIVIAVAIAIAFGLRALLFQTRAGVEMRATVDDRSLATLNGVSPVRTAERSWMISTTLAVLAGILIAPRGGLNATAMALLIVNAYAAAVIGRLRSLPMTVLGAVLLGLATDYSQGYIGSRPQIPGFDYLVGLIGVLPVVILFVSLQFLPQSQLRGTRTLRVKEVSPAPSWRGALSYAAGVVVIAVALAAILSPGDLNSATKVWGYALISLSLVPLIGYAGRLSLCPMAFAAVGAMVVAHLGSNGSVLGLLYAAVITGAVGALVSLTAIRLSGLYLSLSTAAFAVMMDAWILQLPPFTVLGHRIDLFQGGTLAITRFKGFGLDTTSDHAFFVCGAVLFAMATLAVTLLRRSDVALRLIALKDSQVGYATLGLNQRITTLLVFALSAAIAGVGGAVLGAAIQRPAPAIFTFLNGLGVVLPVVLLGVGSIGAALGAGTFIGAPALVNLFPSLTQVSSTTTGLAGIGLGQDPRGAIPQQIRPQWEPVLHAPRVLLGGVGLIAAAYALDVAGLVGNYSFVLVLVGVLLLLPLVAGWALRREVPRAVRDAELDGLSAPPERLGLTVPFTARDLEVLHGA